MDIYEDCGYEMERNRIKTSFAKFRLRLRLRLRLPVSIHADPSNLSWHSISSVQPELLDIF